MKGTRPRDNHMLLQRPSSELKQAANPFVRCSRRLHIPELPALVLRCIRARLRGCAAMMYGTLDGGQK